MSGRAMTDEPTGRYLRDPDEIVRRSFAAIRREADLSSVPDDLVEVVVRMIHACGMPDIVGDLAFTRDAGAAGRAALADGGAIIVDSAMLSHGIRRAWLGAGNMVLCPIEAPGVPALARRLATTRSAAAIESARTDLDGAVVAIGNAPTALFRLLEILAEDASRPALIIAFPPGFVGAVEAKEALIREPYGVPYITLRGRRGGSAVAAAALNALARTNADGEAR